MKIETAIEQKVYLNENLRSVGAADNPPLRGNSASSTTQL